MSLGMGINCMCRVETLKTAYLSTSMPQVYPDAEIVLMSVLSQMTEGPYGQIVIIS